MLISKDTLIGAVALGAGAVAAKVVQKKVIPMVLPTATPNTSNLITLAAGIFIPVLSRNNIATGIGAGMIATSLAGLVDPYLVKAGLGDVMMGDVLMGDYSDFSDNDDAGGIVLGATGGTPFNTARSEYTPENSGEMNY